MSSTFQQAEKILLTSESVTEGHPDKICDQISDAVLDAIFAQDPQSRVACECFTTTGIVIVGGEITTSAYVSVDDIVRQTLRDIGYTDSAFGFDANTCSVLSAIHQQSPDISRGVSDALETRDGEDADTVSKVGAGDQGMMFGYACTETPEYLPLPIALAHRLTKQLAKVRKDGTLPYLRPDGKAQVTVEYSHGKPKRIDAIVVSTQHAPEVSQDTIAADIKQFVIAPVIPAELLDSDTTYFINPTGRFVVGGPMGDTGVTGRKIIVDTYGGIGRHGGGAFSGKDPTKVDRSAAYAARHVAINCVAAGLADRIEVQVAYAIGVAHPVSISVETFGTGHVADALIQDLIEQHFDLRPGAIIKKFDMRRPLYKQCASYGHFGRLDLDLPWEKLDKVDILKQAVSQ